MGVAAAVGGHVVWHSDIDKGACKILKHRWPDVPNLGDITKIEWSAVSPIDVLTGGFPCFPAGTLVDTVNGFQPIEVLRAGDLVRTHLGRYMPVTRTMSRRATDDVVAVKVMGAPPFMTTLEHPFWTRLKSGGVSGLPRVWGDPEWVPAGDLSTAHFVGFQLDVPDATVEPLGEPLAYLVGRWLGDGWIRDRKVAYLCGSHAEAGVVEAAIRAAGFHTKVNGYPERTVTKFTICSVDFVKLLGEFGYGAAGKRLPGWVFRLPFMEQEALWRGWSDADGHTAPNGAVKVTTVSAQLAHGMSRLARNVYRRATSVHKAVLPATTVIEGRTVNQQDQYQVVLPPRNREAFVEGDWCWTPVRSVSPAEPCDVHNISVHDDESYTAWGLTVHNCQDLSTAGKRAGLRPGTRSGLWEHMTYAIATLQPTLVVAENVRGLLSAEAHSDLEPCPMCLGDDPGSALRALGAVLGDLAELGYDAVWHGLRAAEVGAPHGRFRVFVLAYRRGGPVVDTGDDTGAGTEGRRPAHVAGVVEGADRRVGGGAEPAGGGDVPGGAGIVADASSERPGVSLTAVSGEAGEDGFYGSGVGGVAGTAAGADASGGSADDGVVSGGLSHEPGGVGGSACVGGTRPVADACGQRHGGREDPRGMGSVEFGSDDAGPDARSALVDRGSGHVEVSEAEGVFEGCVCTCWVEADRCGCGPDAIVADTGRLSGLEGRQPGPGEAAGGRACGQSGGCDGTRPVGDSDECGGSRSGRVRAGSHGRGEPGDSGGRPVADTDERGSFRDEAGELVGRERPLGRVAVGGDCGTAEDEGRTPADPEGVEQRERVLPELHESGVDVEGGSGPGPEVAWGRYEPAIRRWERMIGRPAPAPTEPSEKGGHRLAPRFVEWMMGLPEGHVTDVPNLSRAEQLKALGNGVVPQQSTLALNLMLRYAGLVAS